MAFHTACLLWLLSFQLITGEGQQIVADSKLEERCNQSGKFFCKVTGRCIDQKFVCDFGRDCGPSDDSDEANCDDYEGRCDFEQPDRCGWISTHDSWLWMDVQAPLKDQPHPLVDHTNQSKRQHFMLVNTKFLDEFKMAEMIGPRVQLKPGHEQCSIRFWINTQVKLSQLEQPLKSPYLVAGFEHVRASELFQPSSSELDENGWRRLEVILYQKGLNRPAIYTLHISFGNLSTDLIKFRNNDGYLAVDDFSFALGCQLAYYEYEANGSICAHNQFKCSRAPSETPETYCIPENRMCDFKPDCGLDLLTRLASDELGCPAEGRFDGAAASLSDFGIELIDFTRSGAFKDELRRPVWYNHAVEVDVIKGRGLQFMSVRERFETNQALVPRDNTTLKVALNNATISWPAFSQAHANCSLQLEYAFSPDSVFLDVFIDVQLENLPERLCYARISPHSQPHKEAGSRHLFEIGLGEQRSKFRVQLGVNASFDGPNKSAGAFTLFGYKFVNCQYAAGLLDVFKSPTIMETGDDGDDDDDEAQLFDIPRGSVIAPSLSCPKGQFQCQSPILCLAESLRCDMQVDCQDSAIDEFDCESLGAKRYDFESDLINQMPSGWLSEQSHLASAFWRVSAPKRFGGTLAHSGPPVDHTHTKPSGKFLSIRARSLDGEQDSMQAIIYTPTMKISPACRRAVFYFYYWQGARERQPNPIDFRVFIAYTSAGRSYVNTELLYEHPIDELSERDWWQRVELQLPKADSKYSSKETSENLHEHFRLVFFGRLHGLKSYGKPEHLDSASHSREAIFAIDDVAFNLNCELALSSKTDLNMTLRVLESGDAHREQTTRVYIGRPFLMLLLLAFIVVVAASLINHRRLHSYHRMSKTDPDQDETLVMSQI